MKKIVFILSLMAITAVGCTSNGTDRNSESANVSVVNSEVDETEQTIIDIVDKIFRTFIKRVLTNVTFEKTKILSIA